jgi:RecJ-like exonuclease
MSELVARSIKQAELDEKLRLWVKENLKVKGQVAYVLNPPGSVGRAANTLGYMEG